MKNLENKKFLICFQNSMGNCQKMLENDERESKSGDNAKKDEK
jgi:hypothetical protein